MMFGVLRTRDYRLLWVGQGISHLGDQFHLIALPWLVLTLTHDPFQLGLVLALAGIPRAAVMLIGGAFADRHSPRVIMLVSDVLRSVIAGALAVSILTGEVQLWMVYALALSFGVVSGFFMPAAEASLPRLLKDEQLEGGNALMMGAAQLMSFVGPALAGAVIALFGAAQVAAGHTASLSGVGVAFAVDAATFAVSALTLVLMRALPALAAGAGSHPFAAVAEGIRFSWRRRVFRWMLGLIAAVNFLVIGPLMVGVPVLAQTRFSQGAAAFGFLMAAYGLGSLCGMVVAGTARRPSSRVFSGLIVGLFAGFGLVIGALAFITSVWVGVALLAVLGVGDGYVAVTMMSVVQRVTPKEMLGRVMSLLMLAMLGLMPASTALAGAVIKLGPEALFVGAGVGLLVVTAVAAAGRRGWSLAALEAASEGSAPDDAATGGALAEPA
jgi:MFS family permease